MSSPESSWFEVGSLADVGNQLRQARESRHMTVEDVAGAVRVRSQYIQGIEEGNWSLLPEAVYVRGFVKRYGDLIGLDGNDLATRLQHLAPTPVPMAGPVSESSKSVAGPAMPLRPIHLWGLYVMLVVAAVTGMSWAVDRTGNPFANLEIPRFSSAPSGPAPAQDQVADSELIDLPFQTLSDWTYIAGVFPPAERDESIIAGDRPSRPNNNDSVQLDLRVVERASWLRVVADGETVFEGTLQPGSAQNWVADQSIILRAGNAGGILLTLNEEEIGLMGDFGEVKEQAFERSVIN